MKHRYVVGGVVFSADEHLAGLATDGFADAELRLRFTIHPTPRSADRPDARAVAGPMETSGVIAPDAHECWLPNLTDDPGHRGWQLRQMAPIFSAAIGRLALHAGAAATPDGVVGLIGASGAGKSTLARFLADRGHTFVADDLLPVRFTPMPSSPAGSRMSPLSALFLLARADKAAIRSVRLDPIPALQGLIEHGFGEHGDPDAWAFQFDAYHRIAEAVPVFSLAIPDDIDALPRVRDAVVALATSDGAASSSGGAG